MYSVHSLQRVRLHLAFSLEAAIGAAWLFSIHGVLFAQNSSTPMPQERIAACSQLLETKQFKKAETCALSLQKAYPSRWDVYALLGKAELGLGNGNQAAAYFRLALNSAPADRTRSLAALLRQTEDANALERESKAGPNSNAQTAPKAASAAGGPSLEDTLAWLSNNLEVLHLRRFKRDARFFGK